MKDFYKEQEEFFDITRKIFENKNISHAYLIESNGYLNTNEVVNEFIKMLLSTSTDYMKVDLEYEKSSGNLIEVLTESNQITTDLIFDLKENFINKGEENKRRVYVIYDSEKLNAAASAKLLKFLEEPSDNITAILIVQNKYRLIDTIISRCQVLSLKNDLNQIEYNEDLLNLIFFDNPFINYNKIIEMFSEKSELKQELIKIELYFLNILNGKIDNNININEKKLTKYITIIEEEVKKLDYNVNYKLWLDNFYARIMEV